MRTAIVTLAACLALSAAADELPGLSPALLAPSLPRPSEDGSSSAVADLRAVEACKANSPTFAQVASCLPMAHVGVVALDAFDDIYPDAALPLKARCIELNSGNPAGALACVTNAIEAAIQLERALPAGATLDDPIFLAVSSADHRDRLRAVMEAARAPFPDPLLWRGTEYQPYR